MLLVQHSLNDSRVALGSSEEAWNSRGAVRSRSYLLKGEIIAGRPPSDNAGDHKIEEGELDGGG